MLQELAAVVGDQHVLTDEASRVFYAQDVYTKAQPALAVVQPADSEEAGRHANGNRTRSAGRAATGSADG